MARNVKDNEILEIFINENKEKETMVFIHGSSFGAWCWKEYFIPFFQSKGYGICCFSFRGHGESWGKGEIHKFGINDYIEDCKKVLQKLNNPCIIVAHSVGCIIALKLLDLIPDISSKIILLAPATNRGMFKNYISIFCKHISSANLLDIYFSNRLEESIIQNYKEKISKVSSKLSIQLLKPFTLPCLQNNKEIIIIGSFADRGIMLNDLYRMGNDLGAITVIFPDICHAMMLDPNWSIVAETILNFIQNKRE